MATTTTSCHYCKNLTNTKCSETHLPFCSSLCQTKYQYASHIGNKTYAANYFRTRHNKRAENLTSLIDLKTLLEKLATGEYKITDAAIATKEMSLGNFTMSACSQMDFIALLQRNRLGGGANGIVSSAYVNGNNDIVLKQVVFDPYTESAFAGAHTETRLFDLFSSDFLMTGACPHLPPLFATAQCATQNRYLNFLISTRAEYGTLAAYLNNRNWFSSQQIFEDVIRQFLFEMTYTFATIQQIYPLFVHCDMKLNNVLAAIGPADGYTRYTFDSDYTFIIPNSGVRSVLWDFDFSSIFSLLDNEKLCTFYHTMPYSGRSQVNVRGVDLHVIALWLHYVLDRFVPIYFRRPASEEFLQQMRETWVLDGWAKVKNDTDAYEWIKTNDIDSKSPLEILRTSPLFKGYLRPVQDGVVVTNSYDSSRAIRRSKQNMLRLYNFPVGGNDRYRPVSVPLWFGGKTDLSFVSSIAYARLAKIPENQTIKTTATIVYNKIAEILGGWLIELQQQKWQFGNVLPSNDKDRLDGAMSIIQKIHQSLPGIHTRWLQLIALFAYYSYPTRYVMPYHFFVDITDGAYTLQEIELAGLQWTWIDIFIILNE